VPYSSAFGADGEPVQCPGTFILQSFRGRVIVVISHAVKSGTTVRTNENEVAWLGGRAGLGAGLRCTRLVVWVTRSQTFRILMWMH